MRLFNRLIGGSRNGGANKEDNLSRGRGNEGASRARLDKKRSLTAKKLGLEALEERQLLSVNPMGADEYDEIREAYANLELPASLSQINVIAVDDLSSGALQAAIDQAAQTEADDLIVLRTTADDYVVNLESTAVTVNIDSEQYGKLTVVGKGEKVLTIETFDVNAFTVLNGDFTIDGAVVWNYSTNDITGDMVFAGPDAKVTLGDQFVVVTETIANDPATGETTTSYLVDRAAMPEDLAASGLLNTTSTAVSQYRVRENPHVDGEDDFNSVRNRVHAVMYSQYDYFGYGHNPSVYWADGLNNGNIIYDAESVGSAGWVGTVANMLAYTGWAQQAGFSTRMRLSDGTYASYNSVEDAVAAYLMNGFINTGAGTAYNWNITAASILDYFFSGNDEDCFGNNYSALTNTIEGGGFFQTIDFGKVGGYTRASDTMLQEMLSVLRKGNAVTMEVQTSDNHGNVWREYVSVWGYVYNADTLVRYGSNGTNNGAATTVGLICSNPTKSAYEQRVTDTRYNNETNPSRTVTLTHYVEEDSTRGDVYDTYHTYLLSGSGSDLRLVHAPYTYLDGNGNVQGAINFPEGFCFYGRNNEQYTTYTSRVLGFSWLQQYNANLSSVEVNQNSVLSLESMPGNTDNVIYLYFGGVEGTGWDGYEHPAFTLDNSAGYGAAELKMIEEIWRRVAEDYAPFNVNVTTSEAVWQSASRGIRCVIGGFDPTESSGGVSNIGSFGASKIDNYVYPYNLGLSAKNIAEAASHEVGHSLGLHHDGYEHSDYYDGEYSGNVTWGPIMGVGYYSEITQWSKGEYVGATQLEDDIAIIASNVGYRADAIGDTIETAAKLSDYYVDIDINAPSATAGTYNVVSYIEKREDYDVYSFKSYGGTYVVDVSGDGADDRFIDDDYSWTLPRQHADTENAVFAGLYYADSYAYTNLNLKVELLDSTGEIVLLGMDGEIMKLSFGESIVLRDSDYYFYVVDQFGKPVYLDAAKTKLKEGYQAVDDSVYSTFSHFVTPELEAGETYYIRVSGVGEGNPSTTGYSDYGSLGKYTLSMHESYEKFRLDAEQVDVSDLTYSTAVDNVLNWREAFVYAGRRLENGNLYLGNALTFNESLVGSTFNLQDTLLFTRSISLKNQPYSPKRFTLNAMNAWDAENDRPGITIDANEKFRAVYVDNTTIEMYGFTITGGVAETTNVIYLYFGGLEEGDVGWSGELHPALDIDGDPTTFNAQELEVINEVYLRVAEDYAPYNVTVTTDQSVFEAATNAIRVVIGGTGNGRGGVAYVGSFGTQKQDCYVFPNSTGGPANAKGIAEAVSHEVGHTMGLGHDGLNSSEYYGGSSLWGPIMGSPYGSTITQWSKGEYGGSTNSQDDISIIAGRLGFKEDDYGDTQKEASALVSSYLNVGNLVEDGIITNEDDVDFFYFVATDPTYVIDVVGAGADFSRTDANGYAASLRITNIDLLVKVYDEEGTLLYTCNPTDSLFAHFQIDGLEVGEKYYFSVEGTGYGDPTVAGAGYSAYGSVGQYYVTVAATTLANFVGEERYESNATKKAIQDGAVAADYVKGETYDQVGQTNNGGGVYNHYGWLTIGNSIIAGNRAYKAGGGVYNQGGEYNVTNQHDGWLYLVDTSIVGNIVTSENAIGGGLYNEDGGVATLANVTIAGNTADYSGGGIENGGRINMYNTIVGGNIARYGADVYTESGNSTNAYSSLIGDESRNASLLAQIGGQDTNNADGLSVIGKSLGTSVSSLVVTEDPGFVAYREYDRADWSPELWKFWNFRLSADSKAVDLGTNYLSSRLDYSNAYVQASKYNTLRMNRFFTTFAKDLAGQARVGGSTVDAGAYELLDAPELTGYVPASAGSDVVNNWESSIVISRAVDDQTGSIAPFLVDEPLYLNLSFINEGAKITDDFETTVYLWKFDAYSKKADMYARATQEAGVPIMTIKVELNGTLPGASARIICTNLATDEVQEFLYDGSTSYVVLENVALGSIEDVVSGLINKNVLPEQNEEGYYLFGYAVDSKNDVAELRENNNFFRTTTYFDVVESPVSVNDSIVVTTDLDVVDPYDGLISLREAVEVYAGSFYYREIALKDGDVFEANGVTYVVQGGKFYVDTTSTYQVYPGEQFYVDNDVEFVAVWDDGNGEFVDSETGLAVAVPNGTTIERGGTTYTYTGTQWLDEALSPYDFADGESVSWSETQTTVVAYVQNVYFNDENKTVAVGEGSVATINGVEYELVDGVWTHTEVVQRYDRDAVQAMGVFTLEDGTEVAVVNGVFRRVATNDVAIVRDGDVVTLADGSTAVYHYAQDRFVVTEVTTVALVDGDQITLSGETLTFRTDSYVDATGSLYNLAEGTEVTLSNGYEVVYRNGKFVYKSLARSATKIAAGTEILWNGESYTYKAGQALMQRVSRESNAVVFDPKLDGATFVLVDGPLTIDKTFTLDCVDPDGNLLDLTITSNSDDPCLFAITEDGDATVMNFKFLNATSTQTGSIFENEGELTIQNVTFANNKMEKGNLIYNARDAKLTIVSSSFANNVATEGALIYNLGDASVAGIYDETSTNTVFTSFIGDSANLGPIYNDGGTLAVQYVDFQNTSAANGGAIHLNGGSATIANVNFTGTTASGMGGAIYATNQANVRKLEDVSFVGTSAKDGGAIAVHSGTTVDASTATFDATSATDKGGAIYNNAGTVNIEGAVFKNATAVDGGAIYNAGALTLVSPVFDGNSATNQGGAVYSADGSGLIFNADDAGNPSAKFTNNSANEGGALYAETPVAFNGDLVATDNEATASYGAFYILGRLNATGTATFERNSAANVGALAVDGAEATLGATRFANNAATGSYGAAYFGITATVESLELVGNSTKGDGSALNVASDLTIGDYAIVSGNFLGGIATGGKVSIGGDATIASNVGGSVKTGGDLTIGGKLNANANVGGAINASGAVEIGGDASLTDNVAEEGSAINATGFVLIKGSATVSGNEATKGKGGAFKVGSFEVKGELNATDNKAADDGGAIYADGAATLAKSTFDNNETQGSGGAIYANGKITIAYGSFVANKAAANAGAVYAGAGLSASNSLFAKNVADALGGAVYAAASTTFVNVTIADNQAADGAGLYNAGTGSATIDNSIVAGNVATGTGYDIYTEDGATTILRDSLLQNIAQVGPKAFETVQAYRSILGVDPEFDADYALKASSPAVNAGANSLDSSPVDLAGNPRRVGLTIEGEVRGVDMGAFEYQTIVAPDLEIIANSVDYWGVEAIVGGVATELGYFVGGTDVCIDFNVQNIGDARVIDNFGFNVKLVGVNAKGETIYDQTLPTQYYQTDFINHDWLDVSDWIDVNGQKTMMTNFGALPLGMYTVTVTLDVEGVGAIYEYGEEDGYVGDNNNVFVGTFNVFSEPSTVVTTELDVEDPTDGEKSLREAIAAAGDYQFVSTFLVADGTTFTLENGQVLTVVDGWLTKTVDVVVKNGVEIDLQEGDEFLLNGRPIYYHFQINGGYFTYGVDPDSARVPQSALESGSVTYPDGTSATFALQTDQYIHYVDEVDLNPPEGTHYTYNVLRTPNGDVVLQDGMSFEFSNVKFTYYQNETYPNGAFVFEDGTVVEYVDGGDLSFASLAIGTLSTRHARVEDKVTLVGGATLEVRNGVARLTKTIDCNVTFDETKMRDKTIVIDPSKGPVVVDRTTRLFGSDASPVFVDRDVSILGEDRNVAISGDNVVNMFSINAATNVSISDLTMTKGYAKIGGAILNKGSLSLTNVDFVDNEAYWIKSTTSGDHLTEGLGGAVANFGTLDVDGGTFSNNKATDFGGAIFADTTGATSVKNASFDGNVAFAGGAIAAQNGTLSVEKTSFTSNQAERAGAVYTLVDMTVVAGVFSNNAARAVDFASRNVVGGAVYGGPDAKLTFKAEPGGESTVAVSFDGNSAEAGGAIYAEKSVDVEGDLVAKNNSAKASEYLNEVKGDYGAIYANGYVKVTGDVVMTGNKADGSYGALLAKGDFAIGGDADISNNAAANGNYGAFKTTGDATVGGNLTANSNSAAGDYGAFEAQSLDVKGDFIASGNVAGGSYGATFVPNGVKVGGNACLSNNQAKSYGAALVGGALDVIGDLTVDGNKATGGSYGAFGADSVAVGGNAAINGNSATGLYGAANVLGQFKVDGNAEISNNTANEVSGVQADSVVVGGDLTVNGNSNPTNTGALASKTSISVVGSATAKDNVGGALIAKTTVDVGGDADLENNSSDQGAAINAGGAVVVVGNAVARNNVATGEGGAIYAKSFEVGGSLTAAGNAAGAKGGAVYSKTYVKVGKGQSNISGNKAGLDGGAIYAINSVEVAGDAIIATNEAGTVPTNVAETSSETIGTNGETIKTTVKTTAFSALGGAIYVAAGGAEFGGDVSFNKNKAQGSAGALYAKGGVKVAGNATFAENSALGYVLTETKTEITPADGSGPSVASEPKTDYIGDYGAAYVDGDLEIEGVFELAGNEANRDYGGMYVAGAVAVKGDAAITGNKAGVDYGALAIGTSMTVGGNLDVSNNEADSASGVYARSIAVLGDMNVVANKAVNAGAALISIAATTVDGNVAIKNNVNGGVNANSLDIVGSLEATDNETTGGGAAVDAATFVKVAGGATISGNKAGDQGGAIRAGGDVKIVGKATITNNSANIGGAISAGSVDLNNSLVANNEAVEKGGAIYAGTIKLVNVTVAGNKAYEGGGLYVLTSAAIDNSIVAGNAVASKEIVVGEDTQTVEGTGVDVFAAVGAKITLRNSLLQNVESTGDVAFGESWMKSEYRCFVNVDPKFADAAAGDYSLQAGSPAINGGDNRLAVPGVDFDLAGGARIVGAEVGGVVYSIDMGAYEYQTAISPDLGFGTDPVNFWFAKINDKTTDHYIAGRDVVLDYSIMNLGDAPVFDKFSVTFSVTGVTATGASYADSKVERYQSGSDYFDWLRSSDWLDVGATQTYYRQNLGSLPVGTYTITITVDSGSEIPELVADNNVYSIEFKVYEAPSVVVTTDADSDAYDPLDDAITLREASELYVGPYWFGSRVLIDAADLVRDDMVAVTVQDGVATTGRNVLVDAGTDVELVDGKEIEYGETYVVYNKGVFTYPDGTTVAYAPAQFDYSYSIDLAMADGSTVTAHRESKFDYLESLGQVPPVSTKYEYVDVVVKPDGSKILFADLQRNSIVYSKTYATYRAEAVKTSTGEIVAIANGAAVVYNGVQGQFMNGGFISDDGSVKVVLADHATLEIVGEDSNLRATYLGATFAFEDGSYVEFVEGGSLATDLGVVYEMAVRRDVVDAAFESADGLRYEFANDGTAWVSTFVGNEITFSQTLVDRSATITLAGKEITPAKDQTIKGASAITVDAASLSGAIYVDVGRSVEIDDLSFVNGRAATGGAIRNAGSLVLNNVNVRDSVAFAANPVDPTDKILYDGLGGAAYNSGNLTINGGSYASNKSTYFGGAVYSIGSLEIVEAGFASNSTDYFGGAVYFQNSNASIVSSVFTDNETKYNGGAIAGAATKAASKLSVVNSLLVKNTSKQAEGGAIYAIGEGAAMEVSLVNDTISDNKAAIGGGVALDSASAEIKNSIVAKNEAAYQGVDVALERTATAVLYASMIGDGSNAVNPDAMTVAEGFSAFVGTTLNPFDPKFGAGYKLTAQSPAVNTGVNSFVEGIDKDVYGNDRIASDYVDMGAVEYAPVAPDLAFGPGALVGVYAKANGVDTGKFDQGWDVCFNYEFANYDSGVVLNSFDYSITIERLDSNGDVVEGSSRVFTKTYGDDVSGFMSREYWLQNGDAVSGYWNVGRLTPGHYRATISVDVNNSVFESNEDNNSFALEFDVAERPSLVVTTELDVVDQYDGLVSLREAIASVGAGTGSSISIDRRLENGATFELAANEGMDVPEGAVATYADGKLTYVKKGYVTVDNVTIEDETVELIANVKYELANGETLVWNGSDSVTLENAIANVITFAPDVCGKTISLEAGELMIDRDLTISGPTDGQTITIDAHNDSRIFFVARATVYANNLVLVNAKADGGAAVYNAGDLTLNEVEIKSATAEQGAGVYNAVNADLKLWNVSFADMNATENGGAIYNAGALVGSGVSFDGSKAVDGAAVYNVGDAKFIQAEFKNGKASDQAGAIYNAEGGTLTIEAKTDSALGVASNVFEGNSAKYGGAIVNYLGTATVSSATFVGNVASDDAGAIDNYGDLALTDVVFNDNKADAGFGGAIYNSLSSTTNAYVVAINGVEFNGNQALKGGAIYNAANSEVVGNNDYVKFGGNAAEEGAAIYNAGVVAAGSKWSFEGNRATGSGAAFYNASGSATFSSVSFLSNSAVNGAAVYNAASFASTNAIFKSNVATGAGAALHNAKGTAKISNAAMSLNEAGTNGGAIFVAEGSVEARNVTIGANVAAQKAGGVYNKGTFNAYNAIVAGNYAPDAVDFYSTTSTASLKNSLLGSTSGVNKKPSMTNSKTGEPGFAVAPIFVEGKVANAEVVDVRLTAKSQAVNSGLNAYALDATGANLDFDLDGNQRVCTSLDSVDMGAYEFPFEEPSTTVNTDKDVVDPTDGQISLREAIEYASRLDASQGGKKVTFDASVSSVTLNSTLYVDSDVVIGNDDRTIEIASSGFDGSLVVVGSENANANVKFVKVDFTGAGNGYDLDDHPDRSGGAMRNFATVTLEKVVVRGNEAAYGGGVYNAGTMTIVESEIVGNRAHYYGGVYNRGALTVERSTIADNEAIYYGGGLGTYTGATISNTLVVGNRASLGAGVYVQVNMMDLLSAASFDVDLINATIVGNTARGDRSESLGGGVWANHRLNVKNSILYGNSASAAADLYATTITPTSQTVLKNSDIGSANIAISGTGVKSVDPMFISFDSSAKWSEWDLGLQIGSKMIDAGDDSYVVGNLDVLGKQRIANKRVDMGAIEEQGNVAPSSITFTKAGDVMSDAAPGYVVGVFEAVDANAGDAFTYELVDDANGAFALDGDKLIVKKRLSAGDYEATVRATDSGDASVDATFTIVVTDPAAPSYATPEITFVGRDVDGNVVVEWKTVDPAKEYVVEYRLKGSSKWNDTGALTDVHGLIRDASFETGDVVEVRIKALASSVKNESEWSGVAEHEIKAAPKSFNVDKQTAKTASGDSVAVVYNVASNADAYAYWKVDWKDGTVETFVGLTMSRNLRHWYEQSGVYTPVLYVDNSEGFELDAVSVVLEASGAVLDLDVETVNVFSELAPVATDAQEFATVDLAVAAAILDQSPVEWNAIAESVSVKAENRESVAIAATSSRTVAPNLAFVAETTDAAFAEFASFDMEAEDAAKLDVELSNSIFDDDFLGDLFED